MNKKTDFSVDVNIKSGIITRTSNGKVSLIVRDPEALEITQRDYPKGTKCVMSSELFDATAKAYTDLEKTLAEIAYSQLPSSFAPKLETTLKTPKLG